MHPLRDPEDFEPLMRQRPPNLPREFRRPEEDASDLPSDFLPVE